MTPDDSAHMQHTAERVATAPAYLDDTQETNQSLSAWLRLDHWRRLQRDQSAGVHRLYLVTERGQGCACGPSQSADDSDGATADDDRDLRTRPPQGDPRQHTATPPPFNAAPSTNGGPGSSNTTSSSVADSATRAARGPPAVRTR